MEILFENILINVKRNCSKGVRTMIKVLFVCLGNICRSPMAEFVFKNMVNKKGLANEFFIDSAATSGYNERAKEGIHYETKNILKQMNIPFEEHISRQIKKDDYDNFDYILGMEEENIKNILKIIGNDKDNKILKLLDFTEKTRDIVDPWYYGNFDSTYYDIEYGCEKFLEYIVKKEQV